MMRALILFMLIATPATAGELPGRALFAPSGGIASVPATSNTSGMVMPSATPTTTSNSIASFMYFAPDKWSFWWHGQRVTPQNIPNGMSDVDVTPAAIRFVFDGAQHEYLTGKF